MALGIVCEDVPVAPVARAKRPYKQRACRRFDEVFACAECGVVFVPKRLARSTWCSAECHINSLRKWPASAVSFPACRWCGGLFAARRANQGLCSGACRSAEDKKRASDKNRETVGQKPPRVCGECTRYFAPTYGDKRKSFCSRACSDRSAKRVRRKVERARFKAVKVEAVNPTRVFERDGWRCRLCGVRTPRKARGTHLDHAPELDHIIPLGAGGEHSYLNTQCLCRKCNGEKGVKPLGQLLLFG